MSFLRVKCITPSTTLLQKRVYFSNHYSISRTMVLFLFLVTICINVLGESSKAKDKTLIISFKQAGVSKTLFWLCLTEIHCVFCVHRLEGNKLLPLKSRHSCNLGYLLPLVQVAHSKYHSFIMNR